MRIVAHASLAGYWRRHPETMLGLKQWEQMVRQAQWRTMQEIVDSLSGVKVLNGERARFAISGGNYRLVVAFNFRRRAA